MGPNPQFPADLVTFTEEILNGKLHFLWSVHGAIFGGFFHLNVSEVYYLRNGNRLLSNYKDITE